MAKVKSVRKYVKDARGENVTAGKCGNRRNWRMCGNAESANSIFIWFWLAEKKIALALIG